MDFIERQSRDFIGREETLNLVKEHIHDGSDVPLVISGADGVGKTSLICKLSSIFSCQTLDRGSGDLIHDSSSKDIQSLTILNGLVLNSKTNYTVDSLQDFLDRLLTFLDFSYDKQVTNHCRNLPTLVREALAIDFDEAKVILLDGIHFFKGTESVPAMLSWLPLKLGKNITVILTVTTNVDSKVFLDELNSRETKPKVIEMSPLEKEEVQQFLKYHLPNKHIGSGLMDQVLAKKDSGNPLWLFFCCLELSHLELWSNVGGVVSKLESMLEDRITQVLVKFPFVNSDDLRCRKIDCDNFKDLIIGTLCLISVSQSGLYENELCEVLSDKDHLLPPLEHVEKGEREKSEKESLQIPQKLPQQIWEQVLKFCLPLLQPSSLPGIFQNGSSKPCFLTFHHPIIKAAVRRVFLDADKDDFSHGQSQGQDQDQNQVQCSKSETSQGTEHYRYKTWWHTKLAKFFENCDNLQRKAEELPYHLKALGDADRLSDYLTEWSTFDLLFKAPFYEAELLLHLWESAGSNEAMSERYRLNLKVNEDLAKDGAKDGSQPREGALLSRDDIMNKYEQVAELMTIAGVYETGIEMAWHAIDVETSELGARPERLATLYDLTSRGYTGTFF
jgi:nephrocystin-3